jgi:MFS family permease
MTVQTPPKLSASEIRTLALASAGGALEFYDFVIFVFFTSIIGKLFFAAGLPDWVRQAQTFGIFAAGYLARPIGGIVIAHFGDTYGRKRMFTFSVFLMAIPSGWPHLCFCCSCAFCKGLPSGERRREPGSSLPSTQVRSE